MYDTIKIFRNYWIYSYKCKFNHKVMISVVNDVYVPCYASDYANILVRMPSNLKFHQKAQD